jgi:phosphoglycolate phosphatase-like HAD superfamily hydrolase
MEDLPFLDFKNLRLPRFRESLNRKAMTQCIVFDLDGTLVKSHETIYRTTIKALETLNLNSDINENKFYNMLGHHFADIFDECGIEVPDVEYFIKIYKGYYFDFIDHSELYSNALNVLEFLKTKNIKTGLLTTKAQDQADLLSEYFNMNKYLDVIEGRKNGVNIKPSPVQFLKICEEVGADPKNSLMVGDTELDILCGKNAGAKTCAVSYGYRDVEEIKKLQPDYLIDNLSQLMNII